MKKFFKEYWAYLKFLIKGELEATPAPIPPPPPPAPSTLLGMKLVENKNIPPNKILIYDEDHKEAVIIDIHDEKSVDFGVETIERWEKENEEVNILAINMWTEGLRCEHTYKRVKTSKEHNAAMRANGVHKDYICSKCGHSYCAVVSQDTKRLSSAWASIVSDSKE